MKTINLPGIIAIIIGMAFVCSTLLGCPAQQAQPVIDQDEPPEAVQTPESREPVSVNIEMGAGYEPMITDEPVGSPETGMPKPAPGSLIFAMDVDNGIVAEDESYNLNFVYEAMVYSGEQTYLREDPGDPKSALISDENGPILYSILERRPGRVEAEAGGEYGMPSFHIEPPENTYVIRYWAEIVVTDGHAEYNFAGAPYCTIDDILMQGELITPEDLEEAE